MNQNDLPVPGLAQFGLSDEEIERALRYALDTAVRIEVKLLPDEAKPNVIKRVVASGLIAWDSRGDKSRSKLIIHLLYLYFIGRLQITHAGYVGRAINTESFISAHEESDDTEWSDDFDFFAEE